jgi:cytochrome c oxidase subunit 2
MPRRRPLIRVLAALSLTIVGVLYVALIVNSFQNGGKPLTTLSPQGGPAQTIQDLVIPVFAVAGVVFVLILGVALFISWRFREREEDDGSFPEQVHGRTKLEIGWTILPAVILAAIAVGTVITILDLEARSDDALRVEVVGQQWWWGFNYDVDGNGTFDDTGDISTATEMVIPVGREVDLTIRSLDVIHSFWIPALNGKRDAVPGMDTTLKIQADEPGVYRGQCTEFCGLSHANMRMLVRAVSAEDYERWVENQLVPASEVPAGSELASAGEATFASMCAQCHVVDGVFDDALETPPPLVAGVAPNLTKLMTRGTFAGSIFNLYAPQEPGAPVPTPGDPGDIGLAGDPGEALFGGDSAYPLNQVTLEAWLRDPGALKPMAADDQRGMPTLGLTEQQIDELVAYLETLK